MDVFGKDTSSNSFSTILYNNFSAGSELEVSGCIHDNAERISINLQGHIRIKQKHKTEKDVRDVAFHLNPRYFFEIAFNLTSISLLSITIFI